ncbi:putative olfactory receptor 8G2 [Mesocricetus auratus]|uniref:Olfactory receptor 8G2 n=1 Tax=Mesocricetus auratus TaxID=10036 RepID=A0A1U8BMD7_MESAU|nr:putative olfactory receptor 8G2 [Mesocricetus auratus]
MEGVNQTMVTGFIFVGLTENPQLQLYLFLIFLGVYLVAVVGNLDMIILILVSFQLHTSIYYLLNSMSFIDGCQSTVITPKILVNFVTQKNVIPYPDYVTQLYFFCAFVVVECHMLAAMAYDLDVPISNPLLYNVTMSCQVCFWTVVGIYCLSLLSATVYTVFLVRLLFCNANIINHYFCDLFPLLEFSCSSTFINEILFFYTFNIVLPDVTNLNSYIFIIVSILHIQSTGGRSKAFSTYSSHILTVAVFYGSTAFMYLQPSSASSLGQSKFLSVFYTFVFPVLIP